MDWLARHGNQGSHRRGLALLLIAPAAAVTMAIAAPGAVASNRALAWGYTDWGRLGDGVSTVIEGSEATTFPIGVCAVGTEGQCPAGPYLNEVTAISAGGAHSVALLGNGTVVAWGENEAGQLGDGTHTGPATCGRKGRVEVERVETRACSATPVAVSGLNEVTAISAGGAHSLALLSNGTVMAWGANGSGQLGDASTENSDLPVTVSGLTGVIAISAGGEHSLALLSDGTVMAWGDNQSGQLGDGTTKNRHVPVAVSALSGASAVAAGSSHSLALLSDGTVMAWGANGDGRLGNGTTENSDVPVAVSGLSATTAISAGYAHSLARLSDGTVLSWGENQSGQLGNGTTENSDVPVAVSGLSGPTAISAGGNHSMALLNSGALAIWGNGCLGQLGIGIGPSGGEVCIRPNDFRFSPVEVGGLSDVNGISAGNSFSLAFGPAAPAVTGVGPTQGLEAGGTSVSIAGTNFTQATAVDFGTTSATSFTVNSATSISAVSPPGTGTVDVTVTTAEGTSSTGPADRFKYIAVPPPTVTKVKPNKGPVAGGTTVTITGASFTEVESVKFGSTDAASYIVNSANSITAVSPPETAGKVNVTVTTPIGASSLSSKDYFKYTPAVTSVSPNSGSKNGGTSVTIGGTGFALGTTATVFKFGTTKATSANCSSTTTCTVIAPARAVGAVDVRASVNKVVSIKSPPADQFTYN